MLLVSWNVENLARFLGSAAAALEALGRPDVLCLQELRIRPRDRELVVAMERALPGYVCHHALADDPENVSFRGGRMYGVATYVRDGLAAAAPRRAPWDREGRVIVVTLPGARLAVVNVYAVNGTSKAYFDHELGRVDGDRHAFKRRFNERLGAFVRPLRDEDLELVMLGDWNVSRAAIDATPRLRTEEPHATARWLFNEVLMPSLDVVDAFRELHPLERKYTWFHPRSRRLDAARVDFALVSRSLLPRVVEADVRESPADRFGSDHAPVVLRLSHGAV